MKILVGCEESGTLRDILRDYGHEAWSNDLEGVEPRGRWSLYHLKGDVRAYLPNRTGQSWDMAFFFTPCTYLCNSGVKWLYKGGVKKNGEDPIRWQNMREGAALFKECLESDIPKIVCENPIMHGYALELIGRDYDQLVQPWHFGHREMKATCFWRKNLPALQWTDVVGPPPTDKKERKAWEVVHRAAPGPNRSRDRSKSYEGIMRAFADQYCGKVSAMSLAS